jgi:asparagine synthase (glutamine-hydrolysing)
MKGSLVERSFAKKMGFSRRDKRLSHSFVKNESYTFAQEQALIFNATQFAHVGEQETKKSLVHGILIRDITRDIRIIAFCLSLPLECYVDREGVERRLVRCYLRDKFPASLIDEKTPRGMQAADWMDRFSSAWGDVYPSILEKCRCSFLDAYIDRDKLDDALKQFETPPSKKDRFAFQQLLSVYSLGLFLHHEEMASGDEA